MQKVTTQRAKRWSYEVHQLTIEAEKRVQYFLPSLGSSIEPRSRRSTRVRCSMQALHWQPGVAAFSDKGLSEQSVHVRTPRHSLEPGLRESVNGVRIRARMEMMK